MLSNIFITSHFPYVFTHLSLIQYAFTYVLFTIIHGGTLNWLSCSHICTNTWSAPNTTKNREWTIYVIHIIHLHLFDPYVTHWSRTLLARHQSQSQLTKSSGLLSCESRLTVSPHREHMYSRKPLSFVNVHLCLVMPIIARWWIGRSTHHSLRGLGACAYRQYLWRSLHAYYTLGTCNTYDLASQWVTSNCVASWAYSVRWVWRRPAQSNYRWHA